MNFIQPPDQDVNSIDLTIRFSASLPDLLLSLPHSSNATTATLKHEIRTRLPDEFSKRRIRLIHAGKALADDASLATTLKKTSSHAPSRSSTPIPPDLEHAKGKAPIRNPPLISRIYIHCSIGDVVLSSAELAAEAASAHSRGPSTNHSKDTVADPQISTVPASRGFDRLLNAGFSPSEVQNLRLQFLAIQAHTHTPEAMPSPNTLRDMEDQWLDNSESNNSTGQTGAGARVGDEEGAAGQLDDMIWGATMGFFWPIGCLLWAFREEGIWSRRRKMAVILGMLVNTGLGTLRWMR
jgi:iron-sulfur cluster assembly 1